MVIDAVNTGMPHPSTINALSATLEQQTVSLQSINRSAAFSGAVDRFQISLHAFRELAACEASRPGRKIILWNSPGWPLLSGPEMNAIGFQGAAADLCKYREFVDAAATSAHHAVQY